MPTFATCPSCQTRLRHDLNPGSRVRCSRCGTAFALNGPEVLDVLPANDAPPTALQTAPGARRRAPAPPPSDRPNRFRRPEYDAPAGHNPLPWVLGGVAVLVILLVAGGVVATLFLFTLSAPAPSTAAAPAPAATFQPPGSPVKGDPPGPPDLHPPAPAPADEPPPPTDPVNAPFDVDPRLERAPAAMVYLTDMQEFDWKKGPWNFGKNGSLGDPEKSRVRVNGRESPHGLGMHPPSKPDHCRVRYALGGKAVVFKAAVGFNDLNNGRPPGPVRFVVFGDGKFLWQSSIMQARNTLEDAVVDVSGVKVLELQVRGEGFNFGSHAVWVEPRVYTDRAAAARDDGGNP
jgi:hypothetical protein